MKTRLSRFRIGIIGGAGPMAGSLLFQEIVKTLQSLYGCLNDGDFPFFLHISYPFEDMLKASLKKESKIKEQLNECFHLLQNNDIQLGVIACNTLHAFLGSEKPRTFRLVHMIEALGNVFKPDTVPLVLCSKTSADIELHRFYFPCLYPEPSFQTFLEQLINRILGGQYSVNDSITLSALLNQFFQSHSILSKSVVLGCTEFSVLNNTFPLKGHGLDPSINIIDSNQVAARTLCEIIKKE